MSGLALKKMIDAYFLSAEPTRFFTGFFSNIRLHNTETVEIDIERDDEDLAIVVQDLSAGYRNNTYDKLTNKEFKPPVFKDSTTLNVFDLFKRDAGQDPFQDVNNQVQMMTRAFKAFRNIQKKIRRSIEQMAAQILLTGKADLKNAAGTTLYTIDYKLRTTHLVAVGTPWSTAATATPLTDISNLARVVRADGLRNPDLLIFGKTAFREFMSTTQVKDWLSNQLRRDLGAIERMQKRGNGGTYHGSIEIDHYVFEMWTYDGMYKDPQTGNKLDYMADEKVILATSGARMDLSFGSCPRIVAPDQRVLPFLPNRMSSVEAGQDFFPNAWVDGPGENLNAGISARPLCIPVAIDSYGVLST